MKICSSKNYPVIRQNHRISGYPALSGYPDPVKKSGYPAGSDPVAKITSGTTLVEILLKGVIGCPYTKVSLAKMFVSIPWVNLSARA